ncbi:Arabinanase/levansucrase/invertase [Delitschia confertaspora ATCC 74209]|uniref:Arabinanase/levansucrase/invertase n=1 Tax=Delitschia confertaspora ATCC 74209 TaxID=1513339 RepID=A0A9P4JFQ2_9PLEO|nr:Arabinanase/levansucrase/invertase [Delitschia confertaspora ATCC 74209]
MDGDMDIMEHVGEDKVFTITDQGTPDPFVVVHGGLFYMTFTTGSSIEIWTSPTLLSLQHSATKTTVWRPPPNTPYSADVWAPELHNVGGQWYVYFAAADPKVGNRSHRMYVLAGPPGNAAPVGHSHYQFGGHQFPGQSVLNSAMGKSEQQWEFLGPLRGLPPDQWAIDGTVIHLNSKTYFVYSGWPLGETVSEKRQELFITELLTPIQTTGALPICISTPTEPWEISGDAGINEGPQWLSLRGTGGRSHGHHHHHLCGMDSTPTWQGIVYSASGSWTPEYCLATLTYNGGNPLDPSSWQKGYGPLLKGRSDGRGPFGPGHGSFVEVVGTEGRKETWAVFHATDKPGGWDGRKARAMIVSVGDDVGAGIAGLGKRELGMGPRIGRGVVGESVDTGRMMNIGVGYGNGHGNITGGGGDAGGGSTEMLVGKQHEDGKRGKRGMLKELGREVKGVMKGILK